MTSEQMDMEIIRAMLSRGEVLCQLAEEAAELGQAALKLRRALEGVNPTPVPVNEAEARLAEEVADVLLCLELAGATAGPGVPAKIDGTMFEKAARWAGRLAAREKETEGR